ncbi:MAG: ATP-binding protein [Euryarchaeota archaeon]|nr:ATP-binding protein [Euryarchaeota archaeon]
MKRIEFHDKERETKEITNILDSEPSLITFVYGPINSGKTALINHLIDQLPEYYAPFYINLRGRFITDYETSKACSSRSTRVARSITLANMRHQHSRI